MKGKSKCKLATSQNQRANASLYQLTFQMLVCSLNETRDEDIQARVLQYSQI